MLGIIIGSLLSALAGIWVFLYYFNRGQFDRLEDAKYQMFREEE